MLNSMIQVASAIGEGCSEKSAFDDALFQINVHDLNLIYLSSVIPWGMGVKEVVRINYEGIKKGDRLYCVAARKVLGTGTSNLDVVVSAAGLGWVLFDDWGLFVEGVLDGDGSSTVEDLQNKLDCILRDSLLQMLDRRSKLDYRDKIRTHVIGTVNSIAEYKCLLVLAAYGYASWF